MASKKKFTVLKIKNIWLRRLFILTALPPFLAILTVVALVEALVEAALAFADSFLSDFPWGAAELIRVSRKSWQK